MSYFGTDEVSTLSFIFGRHADPEEVKSFLKPLSQFFTDKICLEGEKIEAYVGEDPDIIDINFFALERQIDTQTVLQCVSEMPRSVVDYNDPEVKIWSRAYFHKLSHIR